MTAVPGPWVVLIGPPGAGKSTLGEALAKRSGKDFVDIDIAGRPFYLEKGWPVSRIFEDSERDGWVPTERAWEPARAHAVTKVLAQSPGAVVALGAGHTNYCDSKLFAQVKGALSPAQHVVWVQPNPDPVSALDVLRSRNVAHRELNYVFEGHDMLAEWLEDVRARALATHLHFTDGKTVAQSVTALTEVLRQ